MRDELSEHCLCDKCHGYDCGADNPVNILSRPDPIALLEAWRKHTVCNVKLGYASFWMMETRIIDRLRENPDAVREQGVREGWWQE